MCYVNHVRSKSPLIQGSADSKIVGESMLTLMNRFENEFN
jgi:hypothetical protein